MNFELYDNAFQIVMFGIASFLSFMLSFLHSSRSFLIMSFAYACFMMGTLFYTLHIAIIGDIPRVFYVADILWMASYLFYLSLQISRMKDLRLRFRIPALLASIPIVNTACRCHIMGPFPVFIWLFALTTGAIVYLSVFRIVERKQCSRTDLCLITGVYLQIAVYLISAFTDDFTRFNLYFAADIALTITLVMLIPFLYREVKD